MSPILVYHFIDKICRQESIDKKFVAPEALDRLKSCPWPGNVRQLENAVEMAIALSGDRPCLYPSDFPLPAFLSSKPAPSATRVALPDGGLDFDRIVGGIERNILEQALLKTGGNKKLAAEMLCLKRTTLTAKLKSFEAVAGCSPPGVPAR